MRTTLADLLPGLRRRKTLLGLALVWLLALQALLGGLALARIVPAQYAAALTGSLCLPGGDGPAPAGGHDHEQCQTCPHMGAGPALPHPTVLAGAILPLSPVLAAYLLPRERDDRARPDMRAAAPRAPPARA